jgi:hypothetical protein
LYKFLPAIIREVIPIINNVSADVIPIKATTSLGIWMYEKSLSVTLFIRSYTFNFVNTKFIVYKKEVRKKNSMKAKKLAFNSSNLKVIGSLSWHCSGEKYIIKFLLKLTINTNTHRKITAILLILIILLRVFILNVC